MSTAIARLSSLFQGLQNVSKGRVVSKAVSKWRWLRLIYRFTLYVLLANLAFVFVYPFIHMIITSLKSPADLFDITVNIIPTSFYIDNYFAAFMALNYGESAVNSLIITLFATIGHIISCSFIAYGFSRFKFPGREFFFMIVMFSIIVPIQVIIFPYYIMYSNWGWLNTFWPFIVPSFFGFGLRGGLYIFIFRQFFMGLPYELEEAATIDGCGALRTYWNIVLPIAKPATLVTAVLSMVWRWNDYFEPGIYLTKIELWPLPITIPFMYEALEALSGEQTEAFTELLVDGEIFFSEAIVLAGTFMIVLPLLIAYLFLQRHFMESVERTGIVG